MHHNNMCLVVSVIHMTYIRVKLLVFTIIIRVTLYYFITNFVAHSDFLQYDWICDIFLNLYSVEPGPIDNSKLAKAFMNEPLEVPSTAYSILPPALFDYLVHIYGGGPRVQFLLRYVKTYLCPEFAGEESGMASGGSDGTAGAKTCRMEGFHCHWESDESTGISRWNTGNTGTVPYRTGTGIC